MQYSGESLSTRLVLIRPHVDPWLPAMPLQCPELNTLGVVHERLHIPNRSDRLQNLYDPFT